MNEYVITLRRYYYAEYVIFIRTPGNNILTKCSRISKSTNICFIQFANHLYQIYEFLTFYRRDTAYRRQPGRNCHKYARTTLGVIISFLLTLSKHKCKLYLFLRIKMYLIMRKIIFCYRSDIPDQLY